MDESGISLRSTVRKSWAPKGQTPIIKSTGSWRSRTIISLITSLPNGKKPKMLLQIFKHSVKSPDIILAIKGFRKHIKGKVILIWDGLSAHTSAETKEFLKGQNDWLTIKRFPTYAPELNPVEYLWSTMKTRDLVNLSVDKVENLDPHIYRAKKRLQRRPDLLTSFLKKSSLFNRELSR